MLEDALLWRGEAAGRWRVSDGRKNINAINVNFTRIY